MILLVYTEFKGIKRARHIAIIDDELERKEKLSYDLEEQIKVQKNTIANLKLEVQAFGIVKMFVSKIVENLAREKKRLDLFLPYYGPRYNYERNNNLTPLPNRSVWYNYNLPRGKNATA